MPYPFLRPNEQPPERRRGPEPGIRVTFPDGTVHWFPGPSSTLALVLVQGAVPTNLLEHVQTVIEYGTRLESRFVASEVLKGPPRVENPQH